MYIDSPVGFHVACEILSSKVEFRQADLFELSPAEIGQFDVVLFLGVLYHLRHPLLALQRLATLCHGDERPDCPILDDLVGKDRH